MSYVSFHSRLCEILREIPEASFVYTHEPKNPEGFPYIVVLPWEPKFDQLSNCANKVGYTFKVSVYEMQETDTLSREEIDQSIMTLADRIIEKLSIIGRFDDIGAVGTFPQNGGFGYVEREGGFVRVFNFYLTVFKLVSTF